MRVNDNELVTAKELLEYAERSWPSLDNDEWVDKVVSDIKTHREPEYEDGQIYVDAYGEVWRYEYDHRWLGFGDEVSSDFITPKRPLRKLVPESE